MREWPLDSSSLKSFTHWIYFLVTVTELLSYSIRVVVSLDRASLIAQLVKNLPAMQAEICWRRDRLPTPVFFSFPCGSAGKESVCNAGDLGSIPELGRSPREGKRYPLQYSGLENSMGCIVNGVARSGTRLSDFNFHFQINPKVLDTSKT